MRYCFFILTLVFSIAAQAGELSQAYKKEFAYLVSEKKALEQRLDGLKNSQKKELVKVGKEIDALQATFLDNQNLTDRLNRQIVDANRDSDFADNDSLLLETTVSQARESLAKLDKKIDDGKEVANQLALALQLANEVLVGDGKVVSSPGSYFLPGGESVTGQVTHVGRVAKYGNSPQGGGILAPAGNGMFKVWPGNSRAVAEQLADNLYPEQIELFLYDNADKAMEKQEEKTLKDDIRAGGLVGVVIMVLGLAGFVLVAVRVLVLVRASANLQKMAEKVNKKVAGGDVAGALESCKKNVSAAANVIAATLKNLHKERDHIEDIISESILHESSFIDRFGAAILVIAAISPLLGLLGTVTGMISTFDIITEFGTGDPKLLSSGISEALLTTKFGLVVAIPLLLAGNILSSWGQKIKNELEQAALHMINTHKV